MITIIHGDNITESRNYFLNLKQKEKDIILFDGKNITFPDLVQNTEGSGLFNDSKNIFIEDFLSKIKKTDKESKDILNYIAKSSKGNNFVLWESKEILKRDLLVFKDAAVRIFKLPKNIFLFLDNLRPNNSKNLLRLFHEGINSGIKEEMILFMLQRQFRILLALSNPGGNQIEELERLAPWQLGKLESQARMFNPESLKKNYKKLFEIELRQKTGSLPLSLIQTIDFFLLDI
jgi:DNA polymerase III delta subunit